MDSAGNSSSMQSSSGGGGDADDYDDPRADHAVSFSSAAAASYLNASVSNTANLLMMGSRYSHSGLLHQQQLPPQSQQQLPSSLLDYSFLPQRYAAAEEAFRFALAAPRPSSTSETPPGSTSSGAAGSHLLSSAGAADHVDWAAMARRLSTTDHSLAGLMGLPTATSQRPVMQQQQTSTLLAADPGAGDGGPVNYPANKPEATSSSSAAAGNPQPPPSASQQPPPQQQPTQAMAGGAAPSSGGPQGPARVSKKRPRASRRAPTTVLTTDTSNFRQMVQKFTGIPLQPFGPSGSLMLPTRPSLTRMDMFAGNATGTGWPSSSTLFPAEPSAASFLLRPFPQKAAQVPFPSGGGSAASPSAGGLASSLLAPPSVVPPTTSGATGSNSGGSSAMTVLPSSPNRMMMAPSTSDHNTTTGSPSPAASYGLLAPRDHVGGGSSSGSSQIGQRPVGPPRNPGFTFQSVMQQEPLQPYRYYSQPPAPASQQIHRTASLMRDFEYGASPSAAGSGTADMLPTEWAARLLASSSNTNMDGSAPSTVASGRPTDVPEGPPENLPTSSSSSAAAAAATTRAADDLFSWIGSD